MNPIRRRDFMGRMGAGAACTFGGYMMMSHTENGGRKKPLQLSETGCRVSPKELKVNIKPVSNYMIHEGVWTGYRVWRKSIIEVKGRCKRSGPVFRER